jgi:hypothetical protein
MASSPNLKIINRSTTRPALDIDDLAQGGHIIVIKRGRVPVLWIDEDGVLNCSEPIVAPGLGGGGYTVDSFAATMNRLGVLDTLTRLRSERALLIAEHNAARAAMDTALGELDAQIAAATREADEVVGGGG